MGRPRGKLYDLSDVIVDDCDRWLLEDPGWHVWKGHVQRQVRCDHGRGWTTEFLHRAIMKPRSGQFVDHKDGNGLNNSRSNLRTCTRAENNRNSRTRKDSGSGIKGVHKHKQCNRWVAKIRVDGRAIYLGLFTSPEEAAAAYAGASAKYHGEFGRTA